MSRLVLYPAIDLLEGKVVRLHQGDRTKATVYSEDVVSITASFREQGAEWIHVVDLEAAFDGAQARQTKMIREIVREARGIPVQLGGGLRDLAMIESALADGVSRLLIGTVAVENRPLLNEALRRFGPEKIAVAVDEANGLVKTRGWVGGPEGLTATAFAADLATDGVRWFLHSAILRDGTLSGPDIAALKRVAGAVAPHGGQVICAGGVGTLDHLRALRAEAIPSVAGAVAGRALYEHAFTVAQGRAALAGEAA
jgi:phosphoribosylformimino-5-aminoimidazole carboxamide ribotide isomerase